jgi:hypothetical protein
MKKINNFLLLENKLRNFFIGKGLHFQVLGIFFLRKLQKKENYFTYIMARVMRFTVFDTKASQYPTAFDDIDDIDAKENTEKDLTVPKNTLAKFSFF